MFDQTFVNTNARTRKPVIVVLSLGLQVALVAIALLVPVLSPESLHPKVDVPVWIPIRHFKSLPPETPRIPAAHAAPVHPVFDELFHPPSHVPRQVDMTPDAPGDAGTGFGPRRRRRGHYVPFPVSLISCRNAPSLGLHWRPTRFLSRRKVLFAWARESNPPGWCSDRGRRIRPWRRQREYRAPSQNSGNRRGRRNDQESAGDERSASAGQGRARCCKSVAISAHAA